MFLKKERGQEKEDENKTALGHISPSEHISS